MMIGECLGCHQVAALARQGLCALCMDAMTKCPVKPCRFCGKPSTRTVCTECMERRKLNAIPSECACGQTFIYLFGDFDMCPKCRHAQKQKERKSKNANRENANALDEQKPKWTIEIAGFCITATQIRGVYRCDGDLVIDLELHGKRYLAMPIRGLFPANRPAEQLQESYRYLLAEVEC